MRIYTINTNNYIKDLQAPDWVEVITDVEDLGDPIRSSRKDKILCPFEDLSTLQLIHGDAGNAQAELDAIKNHTSEESSRKGVFSCKYNKSLLLAFLLAFFNQLGRVGKEVILLLYFPDHMPSSTFVRAGGSLLLPG